VFQPANTSGVASIRLRAGSGLSKHSRRLAHHSSLEIAANRYRLSSSAGGELANHQTSPSG
jgi:hypothetical protein